MNELTLFSPLDNLHCTFDRELWCNVCLIGRPPSANELYYIDWQARRHRKTATYASWRRSAAATMKGAFLVLDGPVQVEIVACINRNGDLDNLAKPIADALSDSKCIKNDRWIDRVQLHRIEPHGGLPWDLVIVALAPFDPGQPVALGG